MAKQGATRSIDVKVISEREPEDEAMSELINRLEHEADSEIAGGTVSLRWGRPQIAVVKRAAAIVGVPYQTYLKQVVFKQALEDIARAESVLAPPQSRKDR